MYASLLTLDQSTLFYQTLSELYTSDKREHSDGIREWRSAVPKNNPTSQAANSLTSRAISATPSVMSSAGCSSAPSVMSGTGRSSAPSVLTNNIKIVSQSQTSELANPKLVSTIGFNKNGSLSDNDEIMGEEWEVAFASPFKGKK